MVELNEKEMAYVLRLEKWYRKSFRGGLWTIIVGGSISTMVFLYVGITQQRRDCLFISIPLGTMCLITVMHTIIKKKMFLLIMKLLQKPVNEVKVAFPPPTGPSGELE